VEGHTKVTPKTVRACPPERSDGGGACAVTDGRNYAERFWEEKLTISKSNWLEQ
jgi:hypothetical protein